MVIGLSIASASCHGPATGQADNEAAAERAAGLAPAPSLISSDGLPVSSLYYRAASPKALVLLFHQADSSKDEYATIAPRLAKEGFDALAIDQRSGGGLFGGNVTASHVSHPPSFDEARKDLDAAYAWAEKQKLPIIIWGSSYSAALAFELAADHPDAAALLAFSPGEYLNGEKRVRRAAARLELPVYISFADGEEAQARSIFDAVASRRKVLAAPAVRGVHGSSTLIAARNPAGAQANWKSVEDFLALLGLKAGRREQGRPD